MLITQERYSSQVPRPTSHVVVAGLSMILATVIAGWIWNGGSITVFEVFIWRPLGFLAALLGASFWWSRRNAISISQSVKDLFSFVPWALLIALILAFIPIWKLDYASLPMGLGDIGLYFVSLGTAPRLAGPDILFRGFVWGLAIVAGIKSYQKQKDIGIALLDFIVIWVSASAALLLPWLIFLFSCFFSGAPFLAGGRDLMNAFSTAMLNSYWSNLQIVRWFLGFGEQLSHSMVLFLSSVSFIISTIFFATISRSEIWSLIKRIKWQNAALLLLAAITGLIAGWGRAPWATSDFIPWIVLIIVLVLCAILFQAWMEKSNEIFGISLVAALFGSFLLGWPVLACFLAFLCSILVYKNQTEYAEMLSRVLIFITCSGLGLAFARRGDVSTRYMLFIILATLLACLPALLPSRIDWLKRAGIWFVAGVVATLLLQSLVPLAVAVLAIAIWHGIQKFKPEFLKVLPYSIYICALLVLFLAVWLPRLLNPRLLGY